MTSPFGRYNSFEDRRLDEQLRNYNKRIQNLESGGLVLINPNSRLDRYKPSGTETYSSTSNVVFPGLSMTYQKLSALSYLRIEIRCSGFVSVASTRIDFGVDVKDAQGFPFVTDYDIAGYFFNTASEHQYWGYVRNVPDVIDPDTDPALPPGPYDITVLVRTDSDPFKTDGNDLFNLIVTETSQ